MEIEYGKKAFIMSYIAIYDFLSENKPSIWVRRDAKFPVLGKLDSSAMCKSLLLHTRGTSELNTHPGFLCISTATDSSWMSHGLIRVTTGIPRQSSKGLPKHPDKNQPHTSSRHRNPQGNHWSRTEHPSLLEAELPKNCSFWHCLQEGRIIILGISKSSEHRQKNSLY